MDDLQGLVCITPGAGYVDTTGAFVSGLLAGPTCFAACQLKHIFKFDDALDAFGIHGPAGVLGGILTGFFSKKSLTAGVFEGTAGVFEGNAMQLPLQLYGIAVSIGWSMLGTGILLKLIDITLGLRVGIDDELLVHSRPPTSLFLPFSRLSLMDVEHLNVQHLVSRLPTFFLFLFLSLSLSLSLSLYIMSFVNFIRAL